MRRLKYALALNDGGVWGDDPVGDGTDVLVLRSTEQTLDGRWRIDDPAARAVSADAAKSTRLIEGDLLVTKTSGSTRHIGKTTLVDGEVAALKASFGNFMQRLRVTQDCEPRYIWHLMNLQLVRDQFNLMSTSSTGLANLTADIIGRVEVPWWPLRDQHRIANYLDRETAQIDTLISEQEHLLEVLAERRQAAIAEAVMPSGNPLNDAVGWPRIGHGWDVSLGKMLDAGKAVADGSTSLPYVRAGNIQDQGLDLESVNEMPFTPEEATQFDLRAGDLLVVEGGAVGTNVTLTMDMPGWAFQKTVNRARPVNGGDSRWLGYVLRTYRDSGVLDIVCNKSTIAHLTAEKLRGLAVPPCSNSDQKRIADLLDAAVARLDELSREATRCIKLARERRAALITAAVTGQIEIPED